MLHRIPKALFLSISLYTLIGIGSFPSFAEKPGQGQTIKVALLPILDVLPFYVAEAEGFFSEEKVRALAVPVASGLTRDQLMQAGDLRLRARRFGLIHDAVKRKQNRRGQQGDDSHHDHHLDQGERTAPATRPATRLAIDISPPVENVRSKYQPLGASPRFPGRTGR